MPDIPGLRDARPWTNRDATTASVVPESLVVIGGGPVACEMATAWKALGSDVTMVVREERPLAKMEPCAGDAVLGALRDRGVWVTTEANPAHVRRRPDGDVEVTLDGGVVLRASEVLVATGRVPRTGDLGLESVGIEPGGWLDVDDHMCVRAVAGGWMFAAGDVTHRALLTHMGKYEARVCADAITSDASLRPGATATADPDAVPQVVFTDPEVAAVGITERQARERALRVQVLDYDLGDIAGASLYADGYQGHARMIVDQERNVVVGMTFVGAGVGEMLHAATIAVVGEVPLDRLWHAVPAFPTMSEVWLRLLEAAGL